MNIVLWTVQGLLAAMYLMAGLMKTFRTAKAKEQFPWAKNRSDSFVRFVGTSEMLGALGIILPMLTSILPWLTVLAATGLSLIQVLAITTEHLPKKEYQVLPMNAFLLVLSVVIIIGRFSLFI